MTQALNHLITSSAVGTTRASRLRPLVARSLAVTAVAGALVASMYAPALAAPGEVSSGQTTANVAVDSAITLTNLDADFTLSGLPGVRAEANVAYLVTTNAPGYSVTVSTQANFLTSANPDNPDYIEIGALEVTDVNGQLTPMSSYNPVTVDSSDRRTEIYGNQGYTHYEMLIPNVESDVYSAQIDYVATAG